MRTIPLIPLWNFFCNFSKSSSSLDVFFLRHLPNKQWQSGRIDTIFVWEHDWRAETRSVLCNARFCAQTTGRIPRGKRETDCSIPGIRACRQQICCHIFIFPLTGIVSNTNTNNTCHSATCYLYTPSPFFTLSQRCTYSIVRTGNKKNGGNFLEIPRCMWCEAHRPSENSVAMRGISKLGR